MGNTLGIVGEKWSRFASGFPLFLELEELIEAKHAFQKLYHEQKEGKKIQTEVAEHQVTKAEKDIKKFKNKIAGAVHDEVKLGLSQVFQYFHILKITHHFVQILGGFVDHANQPSQKGYQDRQFRERVDILADKFAEKMEHALHEAEKLDKGDISNLMNIINEAAKQDTKNFMGELRTLFKQKGGESLASNLMQRGQLRHEIREELRDINRLKRLSSRLEGLDAKVRQIKSAKDRKKANAILSDFEHVFEEADNDLAELFKFAHFIIKRDLLLMMIVLSDESAMEELGQEWISKHFMPEVVITGEKATLKEIAKHLSEKGHTIANGLNVVEKREQAVLNEVETIRAKARRK